MSLRLLNGPTAPLWAPLSRATLVVLLALGLEACGVDPTALAPSQPPEPKAIAAAKQSAALQAQTFGTAAPARLVVHPSKASLGVGQSVQAIAVGLDANGNALPGIPVSWSAKDGAGKAAAVDPSGRFTPATTGTYTVTAKDASGHAASLTVLAQAAPATKLDDYSA